MAGEHKVFLKQIAAVWRSEFPFLKPVDLCEVPRVPKGCNFLCDKYGEARSRYYFVQVDFSPKCRGQFSIGVAVSPSKDRSTLSGASASELSPYAIGSFGVWQFMRKPRFDWALVDLENESMVMFGISLGLPHSPNVWRPTTYDQPLDRIVVEAIAHVNQTLRAYVFPILQIEPD